MSSQNHKINGYTHPFNAKIPGGVIAGVRDSGNVCAPVANSRLVVPLFCPPIILLNDTQEPAVDFYTPNLYGIAHGVAASVMQSEDAWKAVSRPKRSLLKNPNTEKPSSPPNSNTNPPQEGDQTHPAYAARSKWLEQWEANQRKNLTNTSGRRQVSRNLQPNRVGEFRRQ